MAKRVTHEQIQRLSSKQKKEKMQIAQAPLAEGSEISSSTSEIFPVAVQNIVVNSDELKSDKNSSLEGLQMRAKQPESLQ